ncbi:MAG: 4-phosphoerythronate dehydrogenase [Paludibacteraceae bacterium]|nr:4-phosphoerythronate dehydrogenase [Paludibacteraceae bacterium]
MRIVIDRHIPYLAETVRNGWPDVQISPMKPEEIDAHSVRDADVLVVRTRTRVDAALLQGSRVRLACSATIGFDHIDTDWCTANGIRWTACPGCNAQAVCDYIEESLDEYLAACMPDGLAAQSGLCIGIVGVGHVGSLVAQMAERRGYRVLLNDPPKGIGVSLDEIAQKCDIITFHTPLVHSGSFATYHLCDRAFLERCRPGALIINAARGGVVDEQALAAGSHPFIIDTWENEPDINTAVLERAFRASMHIAGYSDRGKRNATNMCLKAISEEFGLPILSCDKIFVPLHPISGDTAPGWLERITAQLKNAPTRFESLRKAYPLR